MRTVLRHLRAAALLSAAADLSDGELLEAFLARREEAAFKVLVQRHGPMVLGVCRRVLGNCHDAEDAFQATFLVLLRKAASIRPREGVGNWLHGVAYRTALKARTMSAKRRRKERQASEHVRPEEPPDLPSEEMLARLDAELNRLPEKYRRPIVLCDLQGLSRIEAARRLGWPVGTVSWRLAQGRKMLAQRLARHGTVLSVGALAAVLTPEALALPVPSPLLNAAARTARQMILSESLRAGAVPAHLMSLTEGVVKAMFLAKLKITFWVTALVLLAGVGLTGLNYRLTAEEPQQRESSTTTLTTGLASAGTTRLAADDLESLRLEMEALRRELRATRERVKTLESEMSALKGRGPMSSSYRSDKEATRSDAIHDTGRTDRERPAGEKPRSDDRVKERVFTERYRTDSATATRTQSDPLADAERALKRLKQRPDDRQAAEDLENALDRLKKREKPQQPPTNARQFSR